MYQTLNSGSVKGAAIVSRIEQWIYDAAKKEDRFIVCAAEEVAGNECWECEMDTAKLLTVTQGDGSVRLLAKSALDAEQLQEYLLNTRGMPFLSSRSNQADGRESCDSACRIRDARVSADKMLSQMFSSACRYGWTAETGPDDHDELPSGCRHRGNRTDNRRG